MTDESPAVDRRELFRSVMRGLAFGALALGSGFLALRKGSEDCRLTTPCASCGQRDDCDLERRREARRTER